MYTPVGTQQSAGSAEGLRRQSVHHPPRTVSSITQPGVQAAGPPLPEPDRPGPQPKPTPEGRPRHVAAGVPGVQLRDPSLQGFTAFDRFALPGCPRAQLATPRAGAEVCVRFGLRHRRHATRDQDLAVHLGPVEHPRGPGILGELAGLGTAIVSEEHEATLSRFFQEDRAGVRAAIAGRGRQRHGMVLGNPGRRPGPEPRRELPDGIAIQIRRVEQPLRRHRALPGPRHGPQDTEARGPSPGRFVRYRCVSTGASTTAPVPVMERFARVAPPSNTLLTWAPPSGSVNRALVLRPDCAPDGSVTV